MYDISDIFSSPAVKDYQDKYLAQPILNIPTDHKLVLVAVGTFNKKEIHKSKTLIDNNMLQNCIEGIEAAAEYIIDQKIEEFKQYLARNGEQTEYKVTVCLNNEVISQITVDSCYI